MWRDRPGGVRSLRSLPSREEALAARSLSEALTGAGPTQYHQAQAMPWGDSSPSSSFFARTFHRGLFLGALILR